MEKLINGIHHVTAIASDTQKNIDFYTGILGMRLVKKTVNFDASDVYHFYYGDEQGNPGSLLTFFPYAGLVKGRHGKGMLNTTTFSISIDSIDYWLDRLRKFGINFKDPQKRYKNEIVVYLEDTDGLGLELVFNERDDRKGHDNGVIPQQHSIKGIYNVEIWLESYVRTASILTEQLNHQLISESGSRLRFAATDKPGNYVDLICNPETLKGLAGSGTVHHLAFSTPDKETQLEVYRKVQELGRNTSPILDRKYFSSFYFREPGNVLFEIATAGPGFTADESLENLGNGLMLPSQFENQRSALMESLPAFTMDLTKFK